MANHLSKVMWIDSYHSLSKVSSSNRPNLSKVAEECITNPLLCFHKHLVQKSPQYLMAKMAVQISQMEAAAIMAQSQFHHTLCLLIHLRQLHQIIHQLPVDILPIPVEAMSPVEVPVVSLAQRAVLVPMGLNTQEFLHQDTDLTTSHPWPKEDLCLAVLTNTTRIHQGKDSTNPVHKDIKICITNKGNTIGNSGTNSTSHNNKVVI